MSQCLGCQQVTKEKELTSSKDKFKRFGEIEAIARWKDGQVCALHCLNLHGGSQYFYKQGYFVSQSRMALVDKGGVYCRLVFFIFCRTVEIINASIIAFQMHIVRNVEFSPTNWTLPVRLLFASNQIM